MPGFFPSISLLNIYKHLTENCDLLSKLLPGDIVLADRGFDIQDSVGLHCAEVKIPAFTRGKKQLSPLCTGYSCYFINDWNTVRITM
jgi:hypothetical protein